MINKDYWKSDVHKQYYSGMDMEQFKRIKEISHYNFNYYIGLGSDLLFAKSDDDNTTEWYLISGSNEPVYLGVSYVTGGEKLQHESNT